MMTLSARANTFGGIIAILDFRFSIVRSFDNSVRSRENIGWNCETDLCSGFQVDQQLELCWLLNRQIDGFVR
jgi:hypothetical protein